MTSNFTTPQFSEKLINDFGIQIDTKFYHFTKDDKPYIGLELQDCLVNIDTKYEWNIWETIECYEITPAYLLTEVLGWLPERVYFNGRDYVLYSETVDNTRQSKFKYGHYVCVDEEYFILNKWLPAQDLIMAGLTDGWLTKDSITEAIKNRKA